MAKQTNKPVVLKEMKLKSDIDETRKLIEAFEAIDDEEGRRAVLNQWICTLECEKLKEAGLITGSTGVNLNIIRMMVGYAIAKGHRVDLTSQEVREHMALLIGEPTAVEEEGRHEDSVR